jgi:hypothetical protein
MAQVRVPRGSLRAVALMALVTLATSGLPELAAAQSRGGSRGSTSRAARGTGDRGSASARAAVRATRGRASTVRAVPTAPSVRRLPIIGRDGRVLPGEALLRPFVPREAPIGEWVPGDPFDRDVRYDRGRRGRDRDRRHSGDRYGRDRHHRGGFDACGRAGLGVAVGSHGVRVGVDTGNPRLAGFRCASRHGTVIILPVGYTSYYGGAPVDADGTGPDGEAGYYAENAGGTGFSGTDGPGYATGCAAVTVRLRGGEWYGGLVRLPALGAETPEALAAALRTRHRRGRSTMLDGFDGASLGVPAGPGVEGVDVEPCF